MNKLYTAVFCLGMSLPPSLAQAKLLDRIVAIFDDQVITLSEVERIQSNLRARAGIAPDIYPQKKYSRKEIIDKEIDIRTIRAHLREIGYTVSDDQVDSMIHRIQRKFKISRNRLKRELASGKISFPEYFELLRTSREHSILLNLVIEPLVTITEQQIKNVFFRKNVKNNMLAINYSLTAYRISSRQVSKKDLPELLDALKTYREKSVIPQKFSSISKVDIKDVKEGDLERSSQKILKRTDEGGWSRPLLSSGAYTIYYVRNKNLVESELYQKERAGIRRALASKEIKKVLSVWLAGKREGHHIKIL